MSSALSMWRYEIRRGARTFAVRRLAPALFSETLRGGDDAESRSANDPAWRQRQCGPASPTRIAPHAKSRAPDRRRVWRRASDGCAGFQEGAGLAVDGIVG